MAKKFLLTPREVRVAKAAARYVRSPWGVELGWRQKSGRIVV